MNRTYEETVRLMLDIAPALFRSGVFALKGGTAINMFMRDMPRLSVDLDLVYVGKAADRAAALKEIADELDKVRAVLEARGIKVPAARSLANESKLFATRGEYTVKVEVNVVFRGTVLPPVQGELCPAAQERFKRRLKIPMLAPEEIYAGKLMAALDRQHPRDLFDVMLMREHVGLPDLTRQVFVAYLTAGNRPINEILAPNRHDLARPFQAEFAGMTLQPVDLQALEEARDWLFETLPRSLTADEREYLRTFKAGAPDWSRMPFAGLSELPALKWKLQNIQKLKAADPGRHGKLLQALEARLDALPPADGDDAPPPRP